MRFCGLSRPRKGALLLWALHLAGGFGASALAAEPPAEVKPGRVASSFEQLRVNEVADQLIRYLGKAVEWVDRPETRVPVKSLIPKIHAVVLAHPEVRLAGEQRETAAQATREAFAGFLPQVSANVETGKRRLDLVSTPWNFVPAHDESSRAFALTARQLLYDFGAVSNQVSAREALETAAGARSEIKSSELSLRAMSAWLELFRARQILAVSEMNVLSRQQILAFIEEREQLGGSAQSDVLRARARLADAAAAAVAAVNRLTAAEAVYREIFDEPPPAQLPLPEAIPVALERFANLTDWVTRSAHLTEARAQTEAAGHEAKSAAAALLPSVHLDVTARRRDLGGDGVPGLDRTAGIVVKHNLYAGGAELARKRQADHRARETQLGEDNLKRQLGRAFTQAIADVKNSTAAVGARKEAAQVAAVALEAVREQFAFRRGTLLDLLRAQEELYIAGRDLIDSIVDHSLARLRLLHLAMELNPLFELSAATRAVKE